jgi:hypothetical protein
MDYGTGHETSFALFLLCLTLIRFFNPVPEEERDIVLRVFVRYMRLCWKLQDVYKLEPAGSHGVWGLDDYCFLGYIFGSGQLRGSSWSSLWCSQYFGLNDSLIDQTEIPVSSILRPPLPATNLYFMSISRIQEVKHGPFHEHSSQLHSIAVGVPNWGKVNSGLFKMYEVSCKQLPSSVLLFPTWYFLSRRKSWGKGLWYNISHWEGYSNGTPTVGLSKVRGREGVPNNDVFFPFIESKFFSLFVKCI